MTRYGGILGALAANERRHAEVWATRLREHNELQEALAESNVIPFRRKH